MPETFDAIVVGSGISGGWAAKELTQKGLKVLLLERGGDFKQDNENTKKDIWEFPHRGEPSLKYKQEHPVLQRDYPILEVVAGQWANEQENPYVEKKRFDWYRGYHLGGRSVMWGRQSYRWNKMDFEANAKDGYGVDWPIRYEDLAPWYSYVEKFAGIQGSKEGLEVLPDSEFLPAMELNVVEKAVKAKLEAHYQNKRKLIIGRSANLTKIMPEQKRVNCQYRNRCWRGCPFGAYFSTQSATLPAAQATGNLTLKLDSIVTKLIYDKDKKRAKGVEVIDAKTNKTIEYHSKIVFLCASAFNSTWILMNSATDVFPDGLGSSSGQLGRNVMDHHFRLGAQGTVEGFEAFREYGERPTGIYIPRFRNVGDDKRDYLRGFGYQGGAGRGRGVTPAEFTIGVELKNALMQVSDQWHINFLAFGEMLPDPSNRIYLSKDKKDKWGLPVLEMDVEIKANEIAMRKDMMNDAKEMLEVAGVKNISTYDWGYAVGQGIHEMGTARMGRDPKTSVLNGNNQVWDALNVFVTDGACMASSSCVNPSLTYMAITARAANFAVSELKKGNL